LWLTQLAFTLFAVVQKFLILNSYHCCPVNSACKAKEMPWADISLPLWGEFSGQQCNTMKPRNLLGAFLLEKGRRAEPQINKIVL